MNTQAEKGRHFRYLHDHGGAFVIPNPWDAGSARMLEGMGFEALATTSAGFANSLGKLDGQVTLFEKLDHCRALCDATSIPVSADFENGFADDPDTVATNILLLAETGVSGCSIEDYGKGHLYNFTLAVERIEAAVSAVRALDFPFILTARCENLLRGVNDMEDTIRRLAAYEAAGADVLYAPGLRSMDQVRQVLAEVSKPVNVLGTMMPDITLAEYEQAGVKRISLGGSLARHALSAAAGAAETLLGSGSLARVCERLSSQEPSSFWRKA
ncbi:MAG: isocitrate lyase/phosphoenolpyruvate mutase family protein [Pseudomonadales bacterium]|nr:isocitrate lyase/phosphoenolpyruvate mutase family protein [Pseudomonadales bacterium]